MKRFWDKVEAAKMADGYAVLLDGKLIQLPGRPSGEGVLRLSGAAIAQAIADEWQAAGGETGGEMSFADTPLTRLVGTAQDRIAAAPEPVIDSLALYGESDLLCYRVEIPVALARRQSQAWQPWLDWAAVALNAPLRTTTGLAHVPQPNSSLRALRTAVAGFDMVTLAALGVAVPALGSLVLGLAMAFGELDAAESYTLGALDELFQIEFWGEDADAAARRRGVAEDIAVAGRLMTLVRAG